MTNSTIRFARPARRATQIAVAALLGLLTMAGLLLTGASAQAAAPAQPTKTRITMPLTAQGSGEVGTNAVVTGNCGSINLDIELTGDGSQSRLSYGFNTTLGNVFLRFLDFGYQNPRAFVFGSFSDSFAMSPSATYQSSKVVFTGNPVLVFAQMNVRVFTTQGFTCTGLVEDALGTA